MLTLKTTDHDGIAEGTPLGGGASSMMGGFEEPEPIPMSDTILYRYDGQMPIQEVRSGMNGSVVIDSALGARGVEAYSKRTASGTAIGYPLYDAHGNNVATLTKGGGSWSIGGTLRAYDAWGNLAGGSALGDPSGRYCANLGHVQDDESGLVYMRARYYEPSTGRFISEDPAMDGLNWFAYCGGDPVNRVDPSGKYWDSLIAGALGFLTSFAIIWAQTGSAGTAFCAGAVTAIFSAAVSASSTAIGKVAEDLMLANSLALVCKISAGAALNMAAGFLVSLITGDEDYGLIDLLCSAISGGISGGVGGVAATAMDDALIGLFMSSVPSAITGGIDFARS